jgi:hypothetical protein
LAAGGHLAQIPQVPPGFFFMPRSGLPSSRVHQCPAVSSVLLLQYVAGYRNGLGGRDLAGVCCAAVAS